MLSTQTTLHVGARQARVRAALARLGIDRLVLSIHQASFPPGDDDLGYGTPYSTRGHDLAAWAASLGFTGIALGPAGITGPDNPSPYDGTALSRNPLHVALGAIVARGLLDADALAASVVRAERVQYAHAWSAARALLAEVARRARGDAGIVARAAARRAAMPWLAIEARFEAIAAAVGHDDWRRWPAEPPEDGDAAWAFEVAQLLADEQHEAFAARCRALGLGLYGDLPVGVAHRDRWAHAPLFLPGYAIGAPPSRTNPSGQPWEFPVLDPAQPAAVRAFLAERVDRLLGACGGVRIDHPHGWVCPWVYRTTGPAAHDRFAAVQGGARLHESPDLPDHPELAAFARVRPDQLDRTRPRHDDAWVTHLEPAQIDAYATYLDLIVERVRAHGGGPGDLVIEVLSTCPRPLGAVLARHGLGRFRVTQKARVDDPGDVYRGDNAAPADWIMIGNHDTPPLRAVIARWRGTDELARRAAYLGARLGRDPAELAADEDALATAMVAELFLGPARNVLLFWPDLFGLEDVYNRPGVVHPDNWSLRVPRDFDRVPVLDLERALDWALRARTESRS